MQQSFRYLLVRLLAHDCLYKVQGTRTPWFYPCSLLLVWTQGKEHMDLLMLKTKRDNIGGRGHVHT